MVNVLPEAFSNWFQPETDIMSIFASEEDRQSGLRLLSIDPDMESAEIIEAYWRHLRKK